MPSLLRIIIQILIPPALINRRPDNNARMVTVPLNDLRPLIVKPVNILVAKLVCISNLSPHQEPQSISPVEESRVFDLLVLAAPVQPDVL